MSYGSEHEDSGSSNEEDFGVENDEMEED